MDLGDGGTEQADYFGRHRWAYYHPSSFGHNVLRFNNQSQCRTGSGAIVGHSADAAGPTATLDLTDGYSCDGTGWPRRIMRRFAFVDAYQTFVVNDTWSYPLVQQPLMPGTVEWAMHTTARVTIDATDSRRATLTQGNQSVWATLVPRASGSKAIFRTYLPPIMPPDREKSHQPALDPRGR